MGWFSGSSSHHHSSSSSHRPGYARSTSGSSIFSRSHHGSSSSHYKRRPRDGYIARLYHKLKHLIRELYYFARRHPVKIFMMVIMPLISGGVLHKVAKGFGISLPDMLKGSGASGGRGGGGYYGSNGYEKESGSGAADLMGNLSNVGGLLKMAQAFM